MKTSIFFHETFRLSYYHIYLPPAKIWEESEMFGNWTCLPVPPLPTTDNIVDRRHRHRRRRHRRIRRSAPRWHLQ
jgi:hypothetical protein